MILYVLVCLKCSQLEVRSRSSNGIDEVFWNIPAMDSFLAKLQAQAEFKGGTQP